MGRAVRGAVGGAGGRVTRPAASRRQVLGGMCAALSSPSPIETITSGMQPLTPRSHSGPCRRRLARGQALGAAKQLRRAQPLALALLASWVTFILAVQHTRLGASPFEPFGLCNCGPRCVTRQLSQQNEFHMVTQALKHVYYGMVGACGTSRPGWQGWTPHTFARCRLSIGAAARARRSKTAQGCKKRPQTVQRGTLDGRRARHNGGRWRGASRPAQRPMGPAGPAATDGLGKNTSSLQGEGPSAPQRPVNRVWPHHRTPVTRPAPLSRGPATQARPACTPPSILAQAPARQAAKPRGARGRASRARGRPPGAAHDEKPLPFLAPPRPTAASSASRSMMDGCLPASAVRPVSASRRSKM